jgi:hypothetical protein
MDSKLELSDNQSVAASAISTNILDLGDLSDDQRQLGYVYINVLCGTTVLGDALTIHVVTEATAPTDTTGEILATTWASTTATSGTTLLAVQIPLKKCLRYVGIYYTDGGSISAGNVDAWMGLEPVNETLKIQQRPV